MGMPSVSGRKRDDIVAKIGSKTRKVALKQLYVGQAGCLKQHVGTILKDSQDNSGVFQNCTNVLEVATLPMNASAAKTVFENQGILPSRPNIKGETAPPTRAIDEFNPNADERTHVGYSSAENV